MQSCQRHWTRAAALRSALHACSLAALQPADVGSAGEAHASAAQKHSVSRSDTSFECRERTEQRTEDADRAWPEPNAHAHGAGDLLSSALCLCLWLALAAVHHGTPWPFPRSDPQTAESPRRARLCTLALAHGRLHSRTRPRTGGRYRSGPVDQRISGPSSAALVLLCSRCKRSRLAPCLAASHRVLA